MAAPVIMVVGGATVGGALLYAAYRGVPPKLQNAAELVGKNVTLQTLEAIDPPILALGVVGYTQAGKTTFLQKALMRDPGTTRTNKVYAAVLALQTTPASHLALLDGDGEQFPQQFEVAEAADFLLVFVDHNQSDSVSGKSKTRLEEHDRFLKQLEFHLKSRKRSRVHLLLNKRDLWEATKGAAELRTWFEAHVEHFRAANIAAEVTSDIHSNVIADDIGKTVRLILEGTRPS